MDTHDKSGLPGPGHEKVSEPPTRRGVLGLAAASMLLGGAASASARAAPPVPGSQRHVIVVGGGFCGVTAARELRECGVRVTLLEARNRLGGRTFTSDFAGHQVDFGGTWVHWLQPHVWAEISRYGVALDETPGAVADRIIYLDKQGRRHETTAAEQWPRLEKSVSDLFEGGYSIMPRPAEPLADATWMKADTYSLRQKNRRDADARRCAANRRFHDPCMGQRTRKRSILDRHDALVRTDRV